MGTGWVDGRAAAAADRRPRRLDCAAGRSPVLSVALRQPVAGRLRRVPPAQLHGRLRRVGADRVHTRRRGVRGGGGEPTDPHGDRDRQRPAGAEPGRLHRLRRCSSLQRQDRRRAAVRLRDPARCRRPAGSACNVAAGPVPRAAAGGRARRPLPGHLPTGPRRARALPDRTRRSNRLRLSGQPGPGAGGPVLGRSGASPSRHQLAAPAGFGGAGVEAARPNPAQRASTSQRAHRDAHGPIVLPGPAPMVPGRSGPLGGLGGAMPDRRGGRPRLR